MDPIWARTLLGKGLTRAGIKQIGDVVLHSHTYCKLVLRVKVPLSWGGTLRCCGPSFVAMPRLNMKKQQDNGKLGVRLQPTYENNPVPPQPLTPFTAQCMRIANQSSKLLSHPTTFPTPDMPFARAGVPELYGRNGYPKSYEPRSHQVPGSKRNLDPRGRRWRVARDRIGPTLLHC